ncbi:hypothetical protein SDRG_13919 [Saprolegnia diclina VS20]|uniref:Uncharacterized protein n=1 Tax=Saprolegnia diclina (strain VS20) TaxID=1156394 RepID=T0RFC2_SAPDV|nr:hypothetical protein SDRG_13919 [Saprolegnia diclina VS20]EQC28372.1 hypothetical protein SDRG_13919 [Saprolegnia diclina VS20]|eukprot:XP_008618242.1 hypothetical protein SDRG_13919 [Saprolegnia diclina VS20]
MEMKPGVTMTIRFKGELVHEFAVHPSTPDNLYDTTESLTTPHCYSGKEDGGFLPVPNNAGPHALLATAIVKAKQSSEGFLADKCEGPVKDDI